MRFLLVPAALLSSAAIVGCGTTHHSAAGQATPKAAVKAAASSPTPTTSPCAQELAAWKKGLGGINFNQAAGAASAAVSAFQAGSQSAGMVAAQTWEDSASVALRHPMPHCADPAGYYRKYEINWLKAAKLTVNGNLNGAVPFLKKANSYEKKLAAEVAAVGQS